jgi:cysteine dioxygenase
MTMTPQAIYSPTPVPVSRFVEGIRELSEGVITKQKIYDYLVSYELAAEDLESFKHWLPDRHTRNKVFRNDRIEVMIICWPIGVKTPLHTHNGQLGWMVLLQGKLMVENYHKIRCNAAENEQVIPGGPLNTVDKTQTIHRIMNPAEWNERAVSMHIYSLPIDSCVVFDIETQRCFRRDLKYDY